MMQASKPTADRAIEMHLLPSGERSHSYGSTPTDVKTHCYARPVLRRVVPWRITAAACAGTGAWGITLLTQPVTCTPTTCDNNPQVAGLLLTIFGFVAAASIGGVCLIRTVVSLKTSNCCKKDLDDIAPQSEFQCGIECQKGLYLDCCGDITKGPSDDASF
jgi:hypothetical protein